MNSRERQVRRSRLLISDQQLTTFFRAAKGSGVIAVELINKHLNQGKSIDQIFFDGEKYGYTLDVRKKSDESFTIHFGCVAGPDAGDGGEWTVTFEDDCVSSISEYSRWIS